MTPLKFDGKKFGCQSDVERKETVVTYVVGCMAMQDALN